MLPQMLGVRCFKHVIVSKHSENIIYSTNAIRNLNSFHITERGWEWDGNNVTSTLSFREYFSF